MIFTQGPKFRMSLILLFEEREGRERGEGGRGEGLVPDGNYVLIIQHIIIAVKGGYKM